jgi:hypothetical protein
LPSRTCCWIASGSRSTKATRDCQNWGHEMTEVGLQLRGDDLHTRGDPRGPEGTKVALKTYACAVQGP